jgi:hypothetical protein
MEWPISADDKSRLTIKFSSEKVVLFPLEKNM